MLRLTAISLTLLMVLGPMGCRSDDDNGNGTVDDSGGPLPDGGTTSEGGVVSGTTIFKITSGEVGEGTAVVLNDVIITAVDGYGQYTGDVYIQDPQGGPGSGLKLYRPERGDGGEIGELKPGDRVKVEGVVKYYTYSEGFNDSYHPDKVHIKELDQGNKITKLGPGEPPAPADVTVDELTKDPTAEGWEHVLVRVQDVKVTEESDPQYGDYEVSGGLSVAEDLFPHAPSLGQCFSLTGISMYWFRYKLHPRSEADIQTSTNCPVPSQSTIKDIQDETSANHPADGAEVTVTGVITAVDGNPSSSGNYTGFWIQEEAGGPYSGIYVYHTWNDSAATKPAVGEKIELTGTYKEHYDLSELTGASWTSLGQGTMPQPADVNAADVADNGSQAEQYEGVLIRVQSLTVDEVLTDSKGKNVGFKDSSSGLIVDYELHNFFDPSVPAIGTVYSSITGPLTYMFDHFRILPRSAADMVK